MEYFTDRFLKEAMKLSIAISLSIISVLLFNSCMGAPVDNELRIYEITNMMNTMIMCIKSTAAVAKTIQLMLKMKQVQSMAPMSMVVSLKTPKVKTANSQVKW